MHPKRIELQGTALVTDMGPLQSRGPQLGRLSSQTHELRTRHDTAGRTSTRSSTMTAKGLRMEYVMDVGPCRPRASSSDFCSCTQQVSRSTRAAGLCGFRQTSRESMVER